MYNRALIYFTSKGISKREFLEDYSFAETVHILIDDYYKQLNQAKEQVLLARIPLSVMDKDSNEAVNNYLQEIDKRLGINKHNKIPDNYNITQEENKVERMFAM